MPLLHSGTQRNHNDFSSDVSSNAVLLWHQMQFLGANYGCGCVWAVPDFLTKEFPWCFECFPPFFRGFSGFGRGKNSLVFWVVFLGFYQKTKEW